MTNSNGLSDEFMAFLESKPTLKQILDFHPSQKLQQRISELLEKNREGTLTAEEQFELDEFSRMNHFISMVKIRASQKLAEA